MSDVQTEIINGSPNLAIQGSRLQPPRAQRQWLVGGIGIACATQDVEAGVQDGRLRRGRRLLEGAPVISWFLKPINNIYDINT